MDPADPLILRFTRLDPGDHVDQPVRYKLRLPSGETREATLQWGEALGAQLDAVRRVDPEPDLLIRLGEALRSFVLPLGWDLYEAAVLARVRSGARAVLTISSDEPEIFALPWELLPLGPGGPALASRPGFCCATPGPSSRRRGCRALGRAGGCSSPGRMPRACRTCAPPHSSRW